MRLRVITPKQTVLECDDVREVVLPGEAGEVGVLPRHIALITGLGIGEMRVKREGQHARVAVSGGFAEVLADRVTVLADAAELAADIDVQRALEARKRAEELLAKRGHRVDMARAKAALSRAQNRLRIAGETGE